MVEFVLNVCCLVLIFLGGLLFLIRGIFLCRYWKERINVVLLVGIMLILASFIGGFLYIPMESDFTTYRRSPDMTFVNLGTDENGEDIEAKVSFDLVEKRKRNLFTKEWGEKSFFKVENVEVENLDSSKIKEFDNLEISKSKKIDPDVLKIFDMGEE